MDERERVDVIWTQSTIVGWQAFEAIGRPGRFGTPQPMLASPPGGPGGSGVQVGYDASGTARLVLAGPPGELGAIQGAAPFSPGQAPGATQPLGGSSVFGAALGVSPAGHALVAWASNGIWVAGASPGGAFDTAHRVSRATGFDPAVAVASSDSGRGVVMFAFDTQNGGSVSPGPAVAAIGIDARGRSSRAHILDHGGAGVAFAGVDGYGRATVMWTDGTGLHATREQ